MKRRTQPARIYQHELAAEALNRARDEILVALGALGALGTHAAGGPGGICVEEVDALNKASRAIDRARTLCEERLAKDHPGVWSPRTYRPGPARP
jgi:hypothetical protein